MSIVNLPNLGSTIVSLAFIGFKSSYSFNWRRCNCAFSANPPVPSMEPMYYNIVH